jgi:FMN phosphatase YigB (HAD superfamily)
VPPDRALVVGDSLRRDVGGAAAAGLAAAWVNPPGAACPAGSPTAAFEVRTLLDLAVEPGGAPDRNGKE